MSIAAALVGISGWYVVASNKPYIQVVTMKLQGSAPDCPWNRLIALPRDAQGFGDIRTEIAKQVRVTETDANLKLERVETPLRPFWVQAGGTDMKGHDLISYLLTEQTWLEARTPERLVRQGDIVVDCGAHVGVFTANALKRGAKRVISIEPDPRNIECLRRNFKAEIEAGRVTVIPAGAWSEEKTIQLNIGMANSGTGSMIHKEEGAVSIEVPVRPIDKIVAELGVERVDFIKMDIEGAEREALKGAAEILKKYKPRLMMDAYHLEDDPVVLPQVTLSLNKAYKQECGPCELNLNHGQQRILPHVTFWE